MFLMATSAPGPRRKRTPSTHINAIDPEWSTNYLDPGVELVTSHRNEIATNKHIEKLSNTLRRAAQQVTRNSTSDPYIKCTLKPSGHTMQTLPVYGGEFHVQYSPFDNSQIVWQISAEQLKTQRCTLHIEVWDSDMSSEDEFIGETVVFMNEDTGLVQNRPLFASIPIQSAINDGNNQFSGKVQISVLWTDDELELSVLNATHLGTQEDAYKNLDQDFWLIIRCLVIFFAFCSFGAGIFCAAENWTFATGMWFLIVTTTTVGYGDFVPQTDAGKLFNCLYIMLSTVLIGWAFSVVMNYVVSLNTDSLRRQQSREDTMHDVQQKLSKFQRNLWITFAILIAFILCGSVFFSYIAEEKWSYVDSLMFAIATMSTVGYGDHSPESDGGRVFASFFMVFGIMLLARFASNIMEYLLAKRHETMISKIMSNTLITEEQIAEFDADRSGNIDKFEYLSKMLVLTNEVQSHVILNIMKRFDELDYNKDGNISVEDMKLRKSEVQIRNGIQSENKKLVGIELKIDDAHIHS